MKLIKFVVILSAFCANSQNTLNSTLEINYDIQYNTETPNTKKGALFIDKSLNKAIFIYGKKEKEKVELKQANELQYRFSESKRFCLKNLVNDSLVSKVKIFNDEFLVNEKNPELSWQLTTEEKKMDSIKLKRANLNFRGRNYIAWYTPEIPLRFGAWKFGDLPGLIVEVYDETKRYHWRVTSLKKHEENKIIDIDNLKINSPQISIKEYVEKRYNQEISFFNEARLPRGTIVTKDKIKRNGMEIKFEWEEEKTND